VFVGPFRAAEQSLGSWRKQAHDAGRIDDVGLLIRVADPGP
jgi:hypothetical protein